MIIYHGGTDIVKEPRIISTYTGRDFGVGFYTTSIREQAVKWAKRQSLFRKKDIAVLNIYELCDDAFRLLNVKSFDGYTMEWLDFVIDCRRDAGYIHDYDLVMGKIANDDVGETIQAIVDGLTTRDFAFSKLIYMQANDQICFSTGKALNYLKFISEERVI